MRESGRGGMQAAASLQGPSARCGRPHLAGFGGIARQEEGSGSTEYRHQCPSHSSQAQNRLSETGTATETGATYPCSARLQGEMTLQGCKGYLQGEPARFTVVA